jgi:DNA-binding FadR family transcriptional regulator
MLAKQSDDPATSAPAASADEDPPVGRRVLVEPVPGIRLGDTVADALGRMIETGELVHGERLPSERDLMRQFGVSRVAVREAIAALASRGILLTRPGHRPIVQKPDFGVALGTLGGLVRHLVADEAGVWNLFETRIFLEAALVRHAAVHARPANIAELERGLAANREAIGDSPRFYATDVAFHGILYRIPGNPIYPAVHRAYVDWLSEHWARMPRGTLIDRMNYKSHEGIFEAIVRRDADAGERVLRTHLLTAWEFVRTTFGSDPAGGLLAEPENVTDHG